jgi:hypothetical protein
VYGYAKGARQEDETEEYRMVKITNENVRRHDDGKNNLRSPLQYSVWILA